MNRYNVLYTSDVNYFPHMLTSIYSLLESNKQSDLMVHIIEQDFTNQQIKKLEMLFRYYQHANLKLYKWNDSLKKFNIPKWRDTDISNARLFARELLSDLKKILYVDSDTIITQSLSELFNKKIKTPVAAVQDLYIPIHMNDLVNKYYNSGVLLIDYSIWEKEDCTKKIYDTFYNTNIPLLFPDQDLLNIALNDRITTLSLDYNIMALIYDLKKYPYLLKKYCTKNSYYSYDEVITSLENPHIYHMISYINTRPWLENKIHPFNQIYEIYRKKWDYDFKKENSSNFLSQIPIVPIINILSNIYLPKTLNTEIKQFIKEKTCTKKANN